MSRNETNEVRMRQRKKELAQTENLKNPADPFGIRPRSAMKLVERAELKQEQRRRSEEISGVRGSLRMSHMEINEARYRRYGPSPPKTEYEKRAENYKIFLQEWVSRLPLGKLPTIIEGVYLTPKFSKRMADAGQKLETCSDGGLTKLTRGVFIMPAGERRIKEWIASRLYHKLNGEEDITPNLLPKAVESVFQQLIRNNSGVYMNNPCPDNAQFTGDDSKNTHTRKTMNWRIRQDLKLTCGVGMRHEPPIHYKTLAEVFESRRPYKHRAIRTSSKGPDPVLVKEELRRMNTPYLFR